MSVFLKQLLKLPPLSPEPQASYFIYSMFLQSFNVQLLYTEKKMRRVYEVKISYLLLLLLAKEKSHAKNIFFCTYSFLRFSHVSRN